MAKYRAKMEHNRQTIYKLVQTQYDTFQFHKKLIHAALALGMILYGLYADSTMITPLIALFVGCVMLANLNAYPRMQAKQVLEMMGEEYPKSDYHFEEDHFTFNEEAEAVISLRQNNITVTLKVARISSVIIFRHRCNRRKGLPFPALRNL